MRAAPSFSHRLSSFFPSFLPCDRVTSNDAAEGKKPFCWPFINTVPGCTESPPTEMPYGSFHPRLKMNLFPALCIRIPAHVNSMRRTQAASRRISRNAAQLNMRSVLPISSSPLLSSWRRLIAAIDVSMHAFRLHAAGSVLEPNAASS